MGIIDKKSIDNIDNSNVILYKVEENNETGELEYVLENGNKIELCDFNKIEFEEKTFSKIFESISGDSNLKKDYIEQNKGEFPVYTGSHFVEGYINKFKIDFDCLSFNKDNGAGTKCFLHLNEKFNMNSHHFSVKIIDNNNLKYLYYFLNDFFNKNFFGWENPFSFQKNKDLKFSIPKSLSINNQEITSLDIQKSIVKYIEDEYSKIDEKVENINGMILLLNNKKEQILNNVFKKYENLKEYTLKDLNEISKIKLKTENVKDYHNQLYLETGKEDISYYEENNNIYYKEDKLEQTGYKVPAGTILQSKVRPYLKNYLQINNDDLLVSKAFLKFHNSNQLINQLTYLIFNSSKYYNFIINKQDNSGQKPEIDEKTWLKFSFNFIDLNNEKLLKFYINKIEDEYSKIDEKVENLDSIKIILNHKKELILDNIFKEN